MGAFRPKAPKTPDYKGLAETDAAAQLEAAKQITGWNRPTQVGPYGSIQWESTMQGGGYSPEQKARRAELQRQIDQLRSAPSTGATSGRARYTPMIGGKNGRRDTNQRFASKGGGGVDTKRIAALEKELAGISPSEGREVWTQKEVWDPKVKADMDAAMQVNRDRLAALGKQGEFQAPEMVEFDPTAGDKLAADMYESVMGRTRKEQERESNAWDLKLRLQGLQPGTEGYNRAMQNLMTSHGDVSTQAGLQSTAAGYEEARQRFAQQLAAQQQGYSQALQNYTLPWEQAQVAQGLVRGQYTPQFQGFSGATGYNPANLTGAAQSGFEAGMGKYNAKMGKKNNLISAGAGVGAGALIGKSDAALKESIESISGKDALVAILELNGYTWNWKDGSGFDAGVLAQEVQKVLPKLAIKAADGTLMVNYSSLMALAIEAIKYLAEELNK